MQIATCEISGTPRQRGQVHGEGLRRLVVERDRRWKDELGRLTDRPADRAIAAFLEATDFVPAIQRHTPDLLEEVRGIAEGSGLGERDVLAAQFMDEEWWWVTALAGRRHHCSSLGSHHGAGAVVAQNMDLIGWMDGFQAVLQIEGAGGAPDAIVLTLAGMIGLCGMNDHGLGVCVNTLAQLPCSRQGLPVAFVTRGLLGQRARTDAAAFLRRLPHASGQNYLFGDRGGVIDIECSAEGVVEHRTGAESGVWHTNHPLAGRLDADGDQMVASRENTHHRLDAMDRHLAGRKSPVDVAAAKALLADRSDAAHPISRRLGDPSHGYTFASVVWEIGAHELTAHVAPGAPCTVPYASFALAGRPSLAAE